MVTWHDLRREPFRLFFPLGTLFGCLGVSHWLFYALHLSPSSSALFHASVQMGAYMACFIVGFLFTALPRFSSTAIATNGELLVVSALLVAELVCLSVGWWIAAQACVAGLQFVVAWFAGRRFIARRSVVGPPIEFVWIPIGVALGLVGSAALACGQRGLVPGWVTAAGRVMAQQGFVLSIVIGVSGFMAPRLLGHARSVDITLSPAQASRRRARRLLGHATAATAFSASFFLEGFGLAGPAYLMRAAVVTVLLAWATQWYRRPAASDFYLQLLRWSLWMMVLGLWTAGLWPRYRIAMLHLMFVGSLSLMTFAVGTMVVLSHTGGATVLRRPLWVLRIVAWGLGTATVARVLADLRPVFYFRLLGLASSAWLIAAVSWLLFILPRVLRPIPEGAFESLHEAAKQRLR